MERLAFEAGTVVALRFGSSARPSERLRRLVYSSKLDKYSQLQRSVNFMVDKAEVSRPGRQASRLAYIRDIYA